MGKFCVRRTSNGHISANILVQHLGCGLGYSIIAEKPATLVIQASSKTGILLRPVSAQDSKESKSIMLIVNDIHRLLAGVVSVFDFVEFSKSTLCRSAAIA